jgi:hypothetical protein
MLVLRFVGRYSLAILLSALALLTGAEGLLRLSYLQYALLGSFAIYIADQPKAPERLGVAALAGCLCLVARARVGSLALSLRDVGYFLGLASIAMAGVRTAWAAASARRRVFETAAAVTLFPFVVAEALLVRRALNDAYAPTYDLYAFILDSRLGGQLSFALGRLFAHWPRADAFLWEIYTALPFMLGLLYAYTRQRGKPGEGARAAVLLFLASLLAVAGYRVVPIAGPLFAFPGFPVEPPSVGSGHLRLLPLDPEVLRNGVPSLHFAAALLVWWNLRRLGRFPRLIAGFFLVGTFLATLGTGEHYLVDLIMTVPFSLALQAGLMATDVDSAGRRWATVGFGSLLTVAWLGALRSATFVSVVPAPIVIGFSLASVAGPFALEQMLWRSTVPPPRCLEEPRSDQEVI